MKRKEGLLRGVLGASFVLSGLCFLVVLSDVVRLGAGYRGVPIVAVFAVHALFLFLLYLVKRGSLHLASVGLFVIYLIPSLYASARWGIDLPQALLADAILIVMTSVLFGTAEAFALSFGIGVALFLFAWLGSEGILPVNRYWHDEIFTMGDGAAIIATLVFLAAICLLANREIARSLQRARESEKLLRQERDLLEVRVMERTAELRKAQLEKMTQLHRFVEFGRMATGFFHDLASPLNALAFNLELMKESPEARGEASVYLERAGAVTKRLESFLRDIRKHAQEGKDDEQFSLQESLASAITIVEHHAERTGVKIVSTSSEPTTLTGNTIKMHKVLVNLLWNAVDAYEHAPTDRERIVEVRTTGDENTVTLSVGDRGCGISQEQQKRIWEPFYTTKESGQGMGIGLTICKRIVEEDFHGTISFVSEEHRGTTFTLTLPRHGERDSSSHKNTLPLAA